MVTGATIAVDDDPYECAGQAAEALRIRGFADHDVLLVLGSGWTGVLDTWGQPIATTDVTELPGFVAPVALGHTADIRSYDLGGVRVLVILGRTHLYEGLGVGVVVHGVRTGAALGCRVAVLTNANGSLRRAWAPGTCVVVTDHLNLTAKSPLEGPRFVDLTEAYSSRLRSLARQVRPDLVEGVYAMLPGPHYETGAEAAMLARLGADVVGMSTVLEAIAARELGLEVLALSMVTVTEGLDTGIDPSEVVEVARQSASGLSTSLADILRQLKGTR